MLVGVTKSGLLLVLKDSVSKNLMTSLLVLEETSMVLFN